MLRACCAAWACAAGCDYAFRVDHIDLPGDARVDTPSSADANALCASPILLDHFTGPSICSPWGTSYADLGATISETGKLVITPAQTANSIGGCQTQANVPFGSGVTAIVSDVLRGNSTYTVLQVHGPELQIKASGDGMLRFQTSASYDIGTVPYDTEMKWWRVRPMGASTIVGEYSVDGMTWVRLGAAGQTVPANVGIEIAAGTNTTTVTGTGTYELLAICP